MPMPADDDDQRTDEYVKALRLLDTENVLKGAEKLHDYLKRTPMSEFSYSQMQLTVDAMEKLVLALVIDMLGSGYRSFNCPDTIISLAGWRKK